MKDDAPTLVASGDGIDAAWTDLPRYTSGFHGAACDIPYEAWVAPIPEG